MACANLDVGSMGLCIDIQQRKYSIDSGRSNVQGMVIRPIFQRHRPKVDPSRPSHGASGVAETSIATLHVILHVISTGPTFLRLPPDFWIEILV